MCILVGLLIVYVDFNVNLYYLFCMVCYYGGVGLIVEYLWFVGVMWGLYFFRDSD